MRRVAVTGLGIVSPLGCSLDKTWKALCKGTSGVGFLKSLPLEMSPVKIAAEIKDFHLQDWIPDKAECNKLLKTARFFHLNLASVVQAVQDSGLNFEKDPLLKYKTGSLMGEDMLSFSNMEDSWHRIQRGARVSSFAMGSTLFGHISLMLGLKGPNFCFGGGGAGGALSIGHAAYWIKSGICEVMLAGGSASAFSGPAFHGFANMGVLSRREDDPEKASRPWDKDRDGFVLGEGAAVVVLEELEHAKKRGAKIYAEVAGIGQVSEAYHMARPEPEGTAVKKSMENALQEAGLPPEDIDYVNAHASGTRLGDRAEARALFSLFKEGPLVSGTKSMTGHTLGAAGAIEALFCVMSIRDQMVPPTINCDHPEASGLNVLTGTKAKSAKVDAALSNCIGLNGCVTSLVFRKYI